MWVTLYTDASWDTHNEEGGWAVWTRSDRGRIVDSGEVASHITCNNMAEMYAIQRGVELVLSEWDTVTGISVFTDSTTAIYYLRYRPKGTYMLSRKDWKAVRRKVYARLNEHGCKLKMTHVKGHQKSRTTRAWLNNKVDELSRD